MKSFAMLSTSPIEPETGEDRYFIDGCHDAHIKTALAAIFPNAVFKDKYHY